MRVNRWSRKIAGAAVNAMEMTSPGVILGAEVAHPWRAGCAERCTSGSERGVRKHRWAVRLAPTQQRSSTSGERHPCLKTLPDETAGVVSAIVEGAYHSQAAYSKAV